jgi:hypothetical protein
MIRIADLKDSDNYAKKIESQGGKISKRNWPKQKELFV